MTLQILVVLESLTQAFQADGDSWSKLHLIKIGYCYSYIRGPNPEIQSL